MKQREYRLLKDHTFQRVRRPAGFELPLPSQLGAWLVEQGVVELIGESEAIPALLARPVPVPVPVAMPRPMLTSSSAPRGCCGGFRKR